MKQPRKERKPAQMQPTKISKYEPGAEFSPHIDAVNAIYDSECNVVEVLDPYQEPWDPTSSHGTPQP